MTDKPKVAIVVLNWKNSDDTLECLRSSFSSIEEARVEWVVVDNHSQDGVCEKVRAEFPEAVVLENAENLGYAGGNNAGIQRALERGADYILVLNNDAALSEKCLGPLLNEAQADPQIGLLAPKVLLWDDRQRVNSLGTSMDWFRLRPKVGRYGSMDNGEKQSFESDVLMGCALFISRQTIEKVGLLDDRFFLIHEDADWCFRVRKAGLKTKVIPQAVVYHKGSRSLSQVPLKSYYYSIRNFLYLAQKHADFSAMLLTAAGLVLFSIQHAILLLQPREESRKRGAVFFAAVSDFFKGRMGPCNRDWTEKT